jgi:hypothetical protein
MKTILIDDLRSFADDRECLVARAVDVGIRMLNEARSYGDDVELWLDHDLGPGLTIWPIVELLEREHFGNVKKIYVHTSNPPEATRMSVALKKSGYDVVRFGDYGVNRNHWVWVPLREAAGE